MPFKYLQVMTTAPSKDEAGKIARALVEERLAACVQVVGPITSTYWWQGRIETAEEWQCVAKTAIHLIDQIELAIKELHSYEVPEIIATEITAASDDYIAWIDQEVKKP